MAATDGYLLGHSKAELKRLATQARLIDPITRRFLVSAGIREEMRVLDVGSGAGDVAILLAGLVGQEGKSLAPKSRKRQSKPPKAVSGRRRWRMSPSDAAIRLRWPSTSHSTPSSGATSCSSFQTHLPPSLASRAIFVQAASCFSTSSTGGARSSPSAPTMATASNIGLSPAPGSEVFVPANVPHAPSYDSAASLYDHRRSLLRQRPSRPRSLARARRGPRFESRALRTLAKFEGLRPRLSVARCVGSLANVRRRRKSHVLLLIRRSAGSSRLSRLLVLRRRTPVADAPHQRRPFASRICGRDRRLARGARSSPRRRAPRARQIRRSQSSSRTFCCSTGNRTHCAGGLPSSSKAGRIKAVATGNPAGPEGARTIDCGGRVVMPGLIDAHWHCMFAALPIPTLLCGGRRLYLSRRQRRGGAHADARLHHGSGPRRPLVRAQTGDRRRTRARTAHLSVRRHDHDDRRPRRHASPVRSAARARAVR